MLSEGTEDKTPRFLNRGAFDVYGKKNWVLMADVSYYSAVLDKVLTVPQGFTFDFASIPRLGRLLIPKEGYHRYAALLHDWLYASHEVSKRDSDLVFREAMDVLDVILWKERSLYKAVKWFGKSSYGNPRDTLDESRIVDVWNLPSLNRKYRS
jgi:hypothetical protein